LFGVPETEAEVLSDNVIIETLAKKINEKDIKPADITTFDDIKKAIDDILHC